MKDRPTILSQQVNGDKAVLSLRIDPDIAFFQGHFDGYPILAGVVQIHWALDFARELMGLNSRFGGMQALKFKDPILPGALITMTLNWRPDKGLLQFDYRSESSLHSSGRLLLLD